MNSQSLILSKISGWVIKIVLVIFPLFFIPVTRDFLIYSKFYFLAIVVFALTILSFGKLVLTKKFSWHHNIATQGLFLVALSYVLSVILMSPNKLQAIYNPQYGLVMIVMMIIFYFYAVEGFFNSKISPVFFISLSGLFASLISLIIMVDPFKSASLPSYWSFLTNTSFNPVGSSFHFVAFLIFVLVGSSLYIWRVQKDLNREKENENRMIIIIFGIIILFSLLALIFHIFIIAQQVLNQNAQLIIAPVSLSWYSAVEVLKNPMTAIFGVGVDNFAAMFPSVRDVAYNSSSIWQINTFDTSRSTFLHILTEEGLLGLIAFFLLISVFLKNLKKVKLETAGMFYTALIIMLLLPPSIITFFLFFVSLAVIASEVRMFGHADKYIVDLTDLMPILIAIIVITGVLIGSTGYFLGRHFLAEYYFKKSLDAISANSLRQLYDNQVKALQYNSNNEAIHRQFAQTNLLAANNLAAAQGDALTDDDRQTIARAIQTAIVEGKAAVSLNPQKVTNWQVLAGVYRQIINIADQAPQYAISAYQQSIIIDQRNPQLRLDLGGIYYLLQNYDSAQQLFEQAVSLKPDWANAHYNLAWAYYQKGIYGSALDQMQIVVGLIDPATEPADFKNAQKNLDDFKTKYQEELKKLQDAQAEANKSTVNSPTRTELNLPTPPPASLEKKINLPSEASPEATIQ